MITAYILLTNNVGSEFEVIKRMKKVFGRHDQSIAYEIQGVNGVYDIVVKIECISMNDMKNVINEIRKINMITSTATMMVNEEQET